MLLVNTNGRSIARTMNQIVVLIVQLSIHYIPVAQAVGYAVA